MRSGKRPCKQQKLTGLQGPLTGHNDINALFDILKCLRCKKYCTVALGVGTWLGITIGYLKVSIGQDL